MLVSLANEKYLDNSITFPVSMKFFFFSIVLANKIMFAVTKYGFLYTTHYVTLALDYRIDYL